MSEATSPDSKSGTTLMRLTDLSTAAEVEAFIEEQQDDLGLEWFRVGDQNNTGTIEMGGTPEKALIERLTNVTDATLERKALERYGDTETAREALPDNPRDAASELFGLPAGGYEEVDSDRLRELAERARVVLSEASDEDRLTIDLHDQGIGQRPEDFTDTFLSLHGDNKNSKPYLIGRFGQGGSNTFRFADYTIIISRSYTGGPIGWTIVRENKEHEMDDGTTTRAYEFAARPDGSIPTVSADEAEILADGGSVIRLVDYYADGFTGRGDDKLKRSNVSGVMKHHLFASVYPFRVIDSRYQDAETTVKGGRHLLNASKYVDEVTDVDELDGDRTQGTMDVPTKYGTLDTRWWVVDPSQSGQDDTKRAVVNRFVDPANPIVFTLSGQVHHEENKRLLSSADLGFIKDRIIVEVNFDQLDATKRDHVFSSTRDRAMEGEEYKHVRQALEDALDADPELNALDDYYHRKAREGGESADQANEDLADLMNTFDIESNDIAGLEVPGGDAVKTDGGESGSGGDGDGGGPTDPYVPDPVDNLKPEPTWMEIANPAAERGEPITVRQGGTFQLHLRLDAENHFDERDDVHWMPISSGTAAHALNRQNRRRLKNGHTYLVFDVDETVSVGATGEIEIQLAWNDGDDVLSASTDVVVGEPIEQDSADNVSSGAVSPEVIPHEDNTDDTPFNFGEESVVRYIPRDDDRDEVHVALFNSRIQPILNNVTRSENVLNRYTREYMAHLAFEATMEYYQEDDGGIDEETRNRYQNRSAVTLMQAIAKNVDPSTLA